MKKIFFTISLILCFGIFSLTAQTTGSKTALDVSGGSHYADIPDAPSLNPTTQITVEAWIDDVALKTGRMGRTIWVYCKNVYTNQRGEVVQEGSTIMLG